MPSDLTVRSHNIGLNVKINLWSMKKYLLHFNSQKARPSIKGQVANAETKQSRKFSDAGGLVSILGKRNTAKFRRLRSKATTAAT